SVGAAVMRMDLADTRVQMFRDSKSGRLNVVYRREDGNIGWIDPVDGRPADA
ncbi:MAG: sigma 54 modulation/S30EA ribosomal C-terminal domain-containing protein, partial [Rhodospirillales bacterium]